MAATGSQKGTFIVEISSQQNSSWQGTVTWVNEQRKMTFRSGLELIRLIDSALQDPFELDRSEGQA